MQSTKILPLLRRSVFIIFVMLQVFIAWKNFQRIAASQYSASDSIPDWERRLAPLKRAMPFSTGIVGYVSDAGDIGMGYYAMDAQIEYTLTQFAMAPIVVADDSNHEWIIGNLSKEGYNSWLKANPGKLDITSMNSGIYLIHRLDP